MRRGLTASISSNNQRRHILISLVFGRLCNRRLPRCSIEMLDCVRHVDALTVQACVNKRFIQQKPCRSDERSAFAVFSVPGLFANEHHVSVWRPFTENGLRGVFPKWARLAGSSSAAQRVQFAARFAIGADAHGLTKYSTRIQARRARATLPMST